jgi:hypothetical protein
MLRPLIFMPLLAVTLAAFVGCASAPPIKATDSALSVADRAILTAVPLAGAPLHMLTAADPGTDRGTHRTKAQTFCPSGASGVERVLKAFTDLCTARSGKFEDSFCTRPGGQDAVLFAAKLERVGNCVRLNVGEPTGEPNAPRWLAYVSSLGYVNEALRRELAQSAAESRRVIESVTASIKADQAREAFERERSRLMAQLPLMKKRGARVCASQQGTTFVAFVEDWSDERLKLLITDAYRATAPSIRVAPGGPTLIWDEPTNWRLC